MQKRCTVDRKARAGQRLEGGGERHVVEPVMRPGDARAELDRHRAPGGQRIEPRTELAARVGRAHRIVGQSEAAAGQVSLAVAWRMKALRLDRSIRRDTGSRRYSEAIAAFEPRPIALALEPCGELVAERGAVGREPVVGEGERCPDISRPEILRPIDAGLEGIAASFAERLCEAPIR